MRISRTYLRYGAAPRPAPPNIGFPYLSRAPLHPRQDPFSPFFVSHVIDPARVRQRGQLHSPGRGSAPIAPDCPADTTDCGRPRVAHHAGRRPVAWSARPPRQDNLPTTANFCPCPASCLTSEHMCGKNIVIALVPYSSFPFPHLWMGTRFFSQYAPTRYSLPQTTVPHLPWSGALLTTPGQGSLAFPDASSRSARTLRAYCNNKGTGRLHEKGSRQTRSQKEAGRTPARRLVMDTDRCDR